jgi:hypothetical protein
VFRTVAVLPEVATRADLEEICIRQHLFLPLSEFRTQVGKETQHVSKPRRSTASKIAAEALTSNTYSTEADARCHLGVGYSNPHELSLARFPSRSIYWTAVDLKLFNESRLVNWLIATVLRSNSFISFVSG